MRPPLPLGARPPPTLTDPRSVRLSISGAVLLVTAAVVIGLLLYSAQFSGSLQWVLGLAGLAILAAVAWRQVLRGTAEPLPLLGPPPAPTVQLGELEAFSRAVRRAARGLPYSQVLVSSRARAAFLDHAGLVLDRSPDAMRDAQADPEVLRRLIGDEVLADFLYLKVGDLEERYGWVLQARDRGGFAREFADVLDRMEAWR